MKLQNSLFLLLTTALFAASTVAQELQDLSILAADEAYGKEIIKLPVEWAPGMTIEGFEELRFSPGWDNIESHQFWSYVLAWDIKATALLSSSEIEKNLEHYFDGLMKPNHWSQSFPEPLVMLSSSEGKTNENFKGQMKYFDGFHTGKMMSTFILAEQTFCKNTNRAIIIFRISPKPFNDTVWSELARIQKKQNICNHE